MIRVLGLDLSLTASGVALPSGQLLTIKPTGFGDVRLVRIEAALNYYVSQTKPDVAVIEEPLQTKRGGFRTTVALIGVHGVTRLVLARHGVPFAYIHEATLKKYGTGSGVASKQQMIDAYRDASGDLFEVGDDNQADAGWLRAAGHHHYENRAPSIQHALSRQLISGRTSKVVWPDLPRPHKTRQVG